MKYTGYFDGGVAPMNPDGIGTYGCIVYAGNMIAMRKDEMCEQGVGTTNNRAEYFGMLAVLDYLIKRTMPGDEVLIKGDSKLVIMQLKGSWKINARNLKPLFSEALNMIRKMREKKVKVELKHIPRAENQEADELAEKAYKRHVRFCNCRGIYINGFCHKCGCAFGQTEEEEYDEGQGFR